MTTHSSIKEPLNTAGGRLAAHPAEHSIDTDQLPEPQEVPDLIRAVARGHLIRGEISAARQAAEKLAGLQPDRADPTDLLIEIALTEGRADLARTLLAESGAMGTVSPAQSAVASARIAQAEGDLPAAVAILVLAAEDHPDNTTLRTLLAEVMVAAGTAGEARAVLAHLGRPPVNPIPVDEEITEDDAEFPGHPGTPDSRVG